VCRWSVPPYNAAATIDGWPQLHSRILTYPDVRNQSW
jgi:hypothetical protein